MTKAFKMIRKIPYIREKMSKDHNYMKESRKWAIKCYHLLQETNLTLNWVMILNTRGKEKIISR